MNQYLLALAERELGVTEKGGNNLGPRIIEYQEATWLKPDPWPWCAAFVDWCVREWLKDEDVREWLNLNEKQAENFRPRTAGAWDLVNWAKSKKNRVEILLESKRAMPGDIVVFDFSHCGIVKADEGTVITTIEGNTNANGDRDSKKGDGVWQKCRQKTLVRRFLRICPPA